MRDASNRMVCTCAQLPLSNLGSALQQMPAAVAVRAAEFLESPKCGPLPQQTQALVRERAAAAHGAEATAKEAAAKRAAAKVALPLKEEDAAVVGKVLEAGGLKVEHAGE
jgi:hypothetical protein